MENRHQSTTPKSRSSQLHLRQYLQHNFAVDVKSSVESSRANIHPYSAAFTKAQAFIDEQQGSIIWRRCSQWQIVNSRFCSQTLNTEAYSFLDQDSYPKKLLLSNVCNPPPNQSASNLAPPHAR
jgi:hypothetical protein